MLVRMSGVLGEWHAMSADELLVIGARLREIGARARMWKTEFRMRMAIAAVVVMTASVAIADDIGDAQRQAMVGRDSYWNCLAQEYSRSGNKSLSDQEFALRIAAACPSERQNFRVSLVDYLTMQFPDADADTHMTTANNAIALAQKDIVATFVSHRAAAK
jgi:hypothetical protein